MARKALVIGGGLLGVTSAWYLAERGFEVTVVERREASALETSLANGGLVTPSQSDPWNAPGTFAHMLRWLGREDSPLLLRPRALPGMWRWGLRFLWASRAAPWWAATEANLRLGLYSVQALHALCRQLPLRYEGLSAGTLKIFRDREALERSEVLARSLAPLGLQYRTLDAAAAAVLEPLLSPVAGELAGAIHYPEDESGDAHVFSRGLEEQARAAGVKFLFGTVVSGFVHAGNHLAAVRTSRGEIAADVFLLAAGSFSPSLGAKLGLRLPVYPVKGYSMTVDLPPEAPRLGVPLVDFERKVVITPLGSRLRTAGTAEFAGFDTHLNLRRAGNLLQQTLQLLPQLAGRVTEQGTQYWCGLRPMTVDGPPLLGPTRYSNLYLNTGHGPLGWTLGPGSSRAVADLMAGRQVEIDLAAYALARFG